MRTDSTSSGGVDSDRLAVLESQQEELASTLRMQVATIKRLAAAVSSRSAESSAAASAVGGEELVGWVSWLVEHYELDIPACWPRHGAIVEELDALRVGWSDTIGKGHGGLAAMQWHDGLARVVERIENVWGRRCMDGEHHPREPAEWLTAGPDGADDLDLAAARYRTAGDRGAPQE